jgi:hypothetical protein
MIKQQRFIRFNSTSTLMHRPTVHYLLGSGPSIISSCRLCRIKPYEVHLNEVTRPADNRLLEINYELNTARRTHHIRLCQTPITYSWPINETLRPQAAAAVTHRQRLRAHIPNSVHIAYTSQSKLTPFLPLSNVDHIQGITIPLIRQYPVVSAYFLCLVNAHVRFRRQQWAVR